MVRYSELTANGVCYDVEHSPFTVYRDGYNFHFSSHSHAQKFMEQSRMKQEWLTDSMSRRFHVYVDCTVLALIQLYLQIEKRGFYIKSVDGEVFKCPEELALCGLHLEKHVCETR